MLIIKGHAHKVSYYCFSIEQPVKRPICSNIERRFLRRLQKLSNLPKMYLGGLGLLAADKVFHFILHEILIILCDERTEMVAL